MLNAELFERRDMKRLILAVVLCVISLYGKDLRNHILCSNQKTRDVLVMDVDGDWSKPESILWKWNPEGDPNIPADRLKRFNHIDETKVVNGGKQILVTSSTGGMALVDVATKQSVFTGYPGGSPHSADLLPDGTIITASSAGNFLMVFTRIGDEKTAHKTFKLTFADAHGVVWDKLLGLVWAVGKEAVICCRYNFDVENPQLTIVESFPLTPNPYWGHDLILLEKEHKLLMTGRTMLEFDTMTGKVSLFQKRKSVKSISVHPETGAQIVQIPKENYWSDTIVELNGTRKWTLPDNPKIYKARWFAY
jgi:hypothetical protein